MTPLARARPAARNLPRITMAGQAIELLAEGVVFLPQEEMLVVADLHLGKGLAFAATGQMLPPYEALETLARLTRCIERLRPRQVVLLGDSIHRQALAGESLAMVESALAGLAGRAELVWITGNHDPAPGPVPGRVEPGLFLPGGLCLRHEPGDDGRPELIGHFHPAARLATRAGTQKRRCFVVSENRLLLPAFGALTGSLPVSDPAIASLFPAEAARVFLIIGEGLAEVPFAAVG